MSGRAAVYLDSLSQSGETLRFAGKVNGRLCTRTMDEWIDYELTFQEVVSFECRSIDACPWHLESSFDEIEASADEQAPVAAGGVRRAREYLLATYDFVYRIAASSFQFTEVGAVPFVYRVS